MPNLQHRLSSSAYDVVPLVMFGSCAGFIACSLAVVFYVLTSWLERRCAASRVRSSSLSSSKASNSNANNANLSNLRFELQHRMNSKRGNELSIRLRNRLRYQLALERGRPLWNLPAVLELAEACVFAADAEGKQAKTRQRRGWRRSQRREVQQQRQLRKKVGANGVQKGAGHDLQSSRQRRILSSRYRRPQLISRIFNAIASNQLGLRVSRRPEKEATS